MKIKFIILSLILNVAILFPLFNPLKDNTARGNKYYKEKKYNKALQYYHKALNEDPLNSKVLYNIGNVYYQLGEYAQALSNYNKALAGVEDDDTGFLLEHNMGNTFFKQKQYEQAIKEYIKALKLKPDHLATKHNLELARKLLREQSKKQKKQKKQNKKEENRESKQKGSDKQKDKKDQNKKQQSKQNQNRNQKQQQQAQQKKDSSSKTGAGKKISPRKLKQLLKALGEHQKGLSNIMKYKQKAAGEKIEKNW
ncbi:MAG TPA: tetratricopeptide repeat protein [Spirochaetota bacterium]|nr:tetratricopeptide repeat protein [Spirochaetota bacterium]